MSSQENNDVPSLEALKSANPVDVRRTFRRGYHFKLGTGGLCKGFTQANIVGIHNSYAKDFEEFCRFNEGPLPLLHRSQPGEFSVQPLAEDSDIRTDLSAYTMVKDGEDCDVVKDLLPFGDLLNDYVFFYTGCSFSFDKILMDAGIPLDYISNPNLIVSMYKTNIQCQPVGRIMGQMVVTMRLVPKQLVQTAVRVTSPLHDVHGAPIHIGSHETIGIKDLFNPEYGDPPTTLKDGYIPVYWACGNTIKTVLQQTKCPLSFTMYSDCMYLSDQPSHSSSNVTTNIADENQPVVVDMLDDPYTPSLVSERTLEKMVNFQLYLAKQIENNASVNDTFIKTCLSLSHAVSVGFKVDFGKKPNNIHQDAGRKTSLLDVVVIARMLQVLGKDVTLFVQDKDKSDVEKIAELLVHKGILQKAVKLIADLPHRVDYLLSLYGTSRYQDEITSDLSLLPVYGSQMIVGLSDVPTGLYGHAITIALCLLRACPVHDRYRRRGIGFLPSETEIQSLKNKVLNPEKMTVVLNILKDCGDAENSQAVLGLISDLKHYLE